MTYRARCRNPSLLLFDEPLSALDAPVRAELGRELRTLQRELGIPSIVVTHDVREAALLADEILVLVEGSLVQSGPVADVCDNPASAPVARLLGTPNVQVGTVEAPDRLESGGLHIPIRPIDLPPGPPHARPELFLGANPRLAGRVTADPQPQPSTSSRTWYDVKRWSA